MELFNFSLTLNLIVKEIYVKYERVSLKASTLGFEKTRKVKLIALTCELFIRYACNRNVYLLVQTNT